MLEGLEGNSQSLMELAVATERLRSWAQVAVGSGLRDSPSNLWEKLSLANNGEVFSQALVSEEAVGVQLVYMIKGTDIPEHIHDNEVEHVIVYQGLFHLYHKGQERSIQVGEHACFLAGEPHRGTMLENTIIVAITIPRAEGYP